MRIEKALPFKANVTRRTAKGVRHKVQGENESRTSGTGFFTSIPKVVVK